MNATDKIDAARIELLLGELRLPGIKLIWTALAETADKEGTIAILDARRMRFEHEATSVRVDVR
jgi:hypothetical protein